MYPSLPIEQYTLQTPRPNAQIPYKQGLQQSTTTVDAATGYNNHNLLCIPCCKTRLPENVSYQVHAACQPTCLAYTGLESASGV